MEKARQADIENHIGTAVRDYQNLLDLQLRRKPSLESKVAGQLERYDFWATLEEERGTEFALRVRAEVTPPSR